MWDKVLIGVLAGLLLAGCGQSADGQAVGEAPNTQADLKTIAESSIGTSTRGGLPYAPVPEAVAKVQSDFERVLRQGIPKEKFSTVSVLPGDSISGSESGMKTFDDETDRYPMHLVKSHLVPINNISCENGNAYQAWIAIQPFLTRQRTEPAIQMTFVRPYKVLICQTDMTMDYEIVDIVAALTPSDK